MFVNITSSIFIMTTIIVNNNNYFRVVFKWLSKVITWLRLLRLVIGLRTRASFSGNEKQNQNQSHHVRVIFPALWASYR